MFSTPDDVEVLKDLRGLGKPPLFNGNDTDVSFFFVSEDDSILLRHMDDVGGYESRRTPQSHRRNGSPEEPAH